jgi:glycosyltransferase involved in cell wall biosynthesis
MSNGWWGRWTTRSVWVCIVAPEVSVVIPTRDRPKLLALTLRTVRHQTAVDLEIVVVDDGSQGSGTTDTVGSAADTRVRLLRNGTAVGVSAARNRGLEAARGEWVAFCDDDDVWAPNKLQMQLEAGRRSGRSWVYAGAVKVDAGLGIIGGEPPHPPEVVHRRLPRWTLVPGGCSGVLARRELLLDVGGFDESLVNLADWDLWSRLAQTGPPAWAPWPLTGYRFHGGNASQNTRAVLRELELIDGRYGVPVDRAAVHHYLAWVSLRGGRRRKSVSHFVSAATRGDLSVARSASALSMRRWDALRGRPQRPRQHEAWLAQADEWLNGIRDAQTPSADRADSRLNA